jgi:hypothetical protein
MLLCLKSSQWVLSKKLKVITNVNRYYMIYKIFKVW